MSSFDKTMDLARELGYKIEWVERDCVCLKKEEDHTHIEIEFWDNTPSYAFSSASECSSHLKFHSYAGVRKFMEQGEL
jgi:hypothetical protein